MSVVTATGAQTRGLRFNMCPERSLNHTPWAPLHSLPAPTPPLAYSPPSRFHHFMPFLIYHICVCTYILMTTNPLHVLCLTCISDSASLLRPASTPSLTSTTPPATPRSAPYTECCVRAVHAGRTRKSYEACLYAQACCSGAFNLSQM